jgi:hypothetical protein
MRAWLVALGVLAAAPVFAGDGTVGPSKCMAAKFKAGGAYVQTMARCRAKVATKGLPVDLACETKALAKLQTAWAKAEAKGDCLLDGNIGDAQEAGNTYIGALRDIVAAEPLCCTRSLGGGGGPFQCSFVATEDECIGEGGIGVGNPGDACGSSGQCEPPASVEPGACCAIEDDCFAGAVEAGECATAGGTFTATGALCLPSGECSTP